MKRYIVFAFPDYETATLPYSVKGSYGSLDSIEERFEGHEILDTKTGNLFEWDHRNGGSWKDIGNACKRGPN